MGKLGIKEIKKIIEHCAQHGHEVVVGDIVYAVAIRNFSDANVLYCALFGKEDDVQIKKYDSSKKMSFLKSCIDKLNLIENGQVEEYDIPEDISFDENKAYMLSLKKKTEDGIRDGKIKQDKGIEILSKLSIALNDKFAVSEKQDEQKVIVNIKYNHICEWTRKECFLQTKEYAMQKWNLVEAKPENK